METRPILVVEDDDAVRHLIVACLQGDGHRCVAVGDAEAAVAAARHTSLAAALIDNRLPGMQGIDLVGRLHAADPTLPLLLVTGDADVGDRVRGLDAGAVDYIVKPFDPEELLARVRAQLRGRLARADADAVGASPPEAEPEVTIDLTEVSSVYQPLVELSSGRTAGWEALARFVDRTPPLVRFAQASAGGRRHELELLAASRAVAGARSLPAEQFLAVNVSPQLVIDRGPELGSVLAGADRPLVVELTEHEPVADYQALRRALSGLPAKVSVDDAGAGFATLRHVMLLEPDFVKLDRYWIAGIDRDPARQALVAGIARFAGVTGAALVAEGVETDEELAWVTSLDVELGQGFLLGHPAPAIAWS